MKFAVRVLADHDFNDAVERVRAAGCVIGHAFEAFRIFECECAGGLDDLAGVEGISARQSQVFEAR